MELSFLGCYMVLSSEETVTRMLSKNEIVSPIGMKNVWSINNPKYNLGNFLKGVRQEESPWGDKYIFIK